jgi:hypothetical protein
MALVTCKECGNSVSDKAEACPHCGVHSPGAAVGRLQLLRTSSLTAKNHVVKVDVDDAPQGELREGQTLNLGLPAGQHTVKVTGGGLSRSLKVTIRPDATLKFTVCFSNWGILGGGLLLEPA